MDGTFIFSFFFPFSFIHDSFGMKSYMKLNVMSHIYLRLKVYKIQHVGGKYILNKLFKK